jgi:hypothetical protein
MGRSTLIEDRSSVPSWVFLFDNTKEQGNVDILTVRGLAKETYNRVFTSG